MKKAFLVAAATVLLVAAPASAKTVQVNLTKLGFVPATVNIEAGDSVAWINNDTVSHKVVCDTCPFASNVLAPGQVYISTFAQVGKFEIVDPLNENKKGTVTVTPAPPILHLFPSLLIYGGATTLSGVLPSGLANQKIEILAQPCGEKVAKVLATVTTTTNGNFTYQTKPALRTSYQAREKAGGKAVKSPAVTASVRTVVKLRRDAVHRFTAQVVAGQSFVGKAVTLQRWVAARHRWNMVKTVFLGTRAASATPVGRSTVSSATFGAMLRTGLKVRAVFRSGQAGPCYLGAFSATIRS